MTTKTMIFRISLIIFLVEGAIMVAFSVMTGGLHMMAIDYSWFLPLLDTLLLAIFSSPLIYFWAVRPYVVARNEAEAMLLEKNRRFAEAQRVGRVGSWKFDSTLDVFELSEEACRIFGFPASTPNISYQRYLEAVFPEDRDTARQARADLLAGAALATVVYRVLDPAGGVRWVRESGETEETSDREQPRYLGTFQDITKERELEIAKNGFLNAMNHEIRTPLTSIKGSLGLIGAGATGELPEKAKAMVDVAFRNCNRLMLLINDILDLEKAESGMMEFHMAVIDLVVLVREACEANAGYGEQYGVVYECLVPDAPVWVEADADRMMQVMNNLMSNAAKFSKQGEKVEISLAREGDDILVSVRDTGMGIPPEAKATIFDKFTQVSPLENRAKGGTGLGLSIAKEIVERQGGTIDFTSEVGKGTVFTVRLRSQAPQIKIVQGQNAV